MPNYIRKPIAVSAQHYNGYPMLGVCVCKDERGGDPHTHTIDKVGIEGIIGVSVGDWIVTNEHGTVYPVDPATFEKDYQLI